MRLIRGPGRQHRPDRTIRDRRKTPGHGDATWQRHRTAPRWRAQRTIGENTVTGSDPTARGENVMRLGLLRSLLWNARPQASHHQNLHQRASRAGRHGRHVIFRRAPSMMQRRHRAAVAIDRRRTRYARRDPRNYPGDVAPTACRESVPDKFDRWPRQPPHEAKRHPDRHKRLPPGRTACQVARDSPIHYSKARQETPARLRSSDQRPSPDPTNPQRPAPGGTTPPLPRHPERRA